MAEKQDRDRQDNEAPRPEGHDEQTRQANTDVLRMALVQAARQILASFGDDEDRAGLHQGRPPVGAPPVAAEPRPFYGGLIFAASAPGPAAGQGFAAAPAYASYGGPGGYGAYPPGYGGAPHWGPPLHVAPPSLTAEPRPYYGGIILAAPAPGYPGGPGPVAPPVPPGYYGSYGDWYGWSRG